MFRIQELKKERHLNSKGTVNQGLPTAKGKATPGGSGMDYLPPLLHVSVTRQKTEESGCEDLTSR